MRVSFENESNFGLQGLLIEPTVNRDASEYLASHYDEIVKKVRSMGVPFNNAKDLVHDVLISFINAENEGKGYDSTYSDELISLEQFVYGRLKGYSKNARYYSEGVEVGGTTVEFSKGKTQITSGYVNSDGELVTKQSKQKEKRKVSVIVGSASFDEANGESDSNDGFQLAYMMASTTDDLADVEESLAIREQLDYCLDFSDLHGLKIINILKNIDLLASNLQDASRRRKTHNSLFEELAEMVRVNDEFAEALRSVLDYSGKHRNEFQLLLAQY